MNSIFLLSDDQIEEVHFNLWITGSDDSFLDVGLKLNKDQKVELHLPWKNAKPEDLFNTIKDKGVLSAIFNEHLSVRDKTKNNSYVTAEFGEKEIYVVQSKFDLETEESNNIFTKIIISSKYSGEEHSGKEQFYVRFRFKGIGTNVFSKDHTGTDAFISPYRESIEVIDFRINEVRTVSSGVLNTTIQKTPAIKKIHFFLLKSYQENNTLASPDYLRCRELEDKAWDKYLPKRKPNDATLAYHWKTKEELKEDNHYSILATFTKKKTSWRIIFFYFLLIVALGYLSCYLYDFFKPNWALPNAPIGNTIFSCDSFKSALELPKTPTE